MNNIKKYNNFINAYNEGISWWEKGELKDEEEDDKIEEFQVGDMVSYTDKTYWDENVGYTGNFPNNNGYGIKWHTSSDTSREIRKITKTGYVEDIQGYTGQVVQLQSKWPWYQTNGMVKLTKESISLKLNEWDEWEEEDEMDDPIISVGDRVEVTGSLRLPWNERDDERNFNKSQGEVIRIFGATDRQGFGFYGSIDKQRNSGDYVDIVIKFDDRTDLGKSRLSDRTDCAKFSGMQLDEDENEYVYGNKVIRIKKI
jgi:ribosomal protein L19